MSKIAEAAALKAYPEKIIEHVENPGFVVKRDLNRFDRNVYIQGYEQAEKDTIERAIKFIETLTHPDDVLIRKTLIKAFIRHMEED